MVAEPVITWNLYFTPLAVGTSTGIIVFYISRLFKKQDAKDRKIENLLAEAILLKEQNTIEWRKTYSSTIERIKETLDHIEESLLVKVDKPDCIRETSDIWDAVNKIRERKSI